MADNKEALPVVAWHSSYRLWHGKTHHTLTFQALSRAAPALHEPEFKEKPLTDHATATAALSELRAEVERQRIKLAHDVEPFAVDQLLRRVVVNAASLHRASSGPFWSRLKALTGLGSNCSAGLALWAGFDPETGDTRSAASGATPNTTEGE